jgi:hypothetical protein
MHFILILLLNILCVWGIVEHLKVSIKGFSKFMVHFGVTSFGSKCGLFVREMQSGYVFNYIAILLAVLVIFPVLLETPYFIYFV